MDRYEFNKTSIQNGRKAYNSTKLPDIPKLSSDKYIFSRAGDRLDLLADEFFGDPRLWWIIARANNLGKGTLLVPEGLQVRIPDQTTVTNIQEILRITSETR